MQSDDLFARRFRRQSPRPPLTLGSFDPAQAPQEWPPRRDEDGGAGLRSPGRAHMMQRSNSDVTVGEEYRSLSSLEGRRDGQACLSPSALRFKDPLLLLGLPPAGCSRMQSAPAGDPPKPGKHSKAESQSKKAKLGGRVRSLAHYDVQSVLFDLAEVASNRDSVGRKKNITSGASAASRPGAPNPAAPPSPSQGRRGGGRGLEGPEGSLEPLDEGGGNDGDMLLSCPHFLNETGGEERAGLGRGGAGPGGAQRPNDAVSVLEEPRESHVEQSSFFIEHADLGALYYRKYFYNKDHQNFLGVDERLGPLAISFRRDEKDSSGGAQYNYRIIIRTTEVQDTLLKLDEQGLSFQRKVGVMYCRAGQSSEEEMYNNESAGPALDQFLNLLGERVRLQGFSKYRAQLDTKTDSTGTHSLYTRYQGYEIMFHVSTMLPYTATNAQQLLRKRHIGNDIVTIIFQEPGALAFTPKVIRSHFQHVFIIVRVYHPCTERTYYRVAVTRSKDIPLFGPPFPQGALFPHSPAFRDFLLAKAVSGECAAEKSEKFRSMATRTRQEYLRDLAENFSTAASVDSSSGKFPLLSLASRRREKLKGARGAELHSAGALVWAAVVLIERRRRAVLFNCSCRDVIGWRAGAGGGAGAQDELDIFYERGQSVTVCMADGQEEDVQEVVQRLKLVTRGCEAWQMTPLRDGVGQPGFLLNEEGLVVELQRFGYAESGGLRVGSRVVRLCGRPLVSLTLEQRAKLIRSAPKIQLTVIPRIGTGHRAGVFQSCTRKPPRRGKGRPGGDNPPVEPADIPAPSPARCCSLEPHQCSDWHVYDNVKLPADRHDATGAADRHIYENLWEVRDATPDLILALGPKLPPEEEEEELQKQFVGVELDEASGPSQQSAPRTHLDRADRSSRVLSVQMSISRMLSEAADSGEDEWRCITELSAVSHGILEALSREECRSGDGEMAMGGRPAAEGNADAEFSEHRDSDSPGGCLEDKVAQLESRLKSLQDDLQKEKQDKAVLQAEVLSLRDNNQRLQDESQSTVARLIKVTELLCKAVHHIVPPRMCLRCAAEANSGNVSLARPVLPDTARVVVRNTSCFLPEAETIGDATPGSAQTGLTPPGLSSLPE
ncbi:hypothetical protein AAFF_G00272830 [Aldrovandia affinis]|uniref:Uncharacterized protein n=1 Tax=Aldrovandia affinis TaxID=143900 RepID=A0AAD7RAQ3_9TELE|nr:hypothetical protein AAFF_G00272830 [Aldrovandia affinis]